MYKKTILIVFALIIINCIFIDVNGEIESNNIILSGDAELEAYVNSHFYNGDGSSEAPYILNISQSISLKNISRYVIIYIITEDYINIFIDNSSNISISTSILSNINIEITNSSNIFLNNNTCKSEGFRIFYYNSEFIYINDNYLNNNKLNYLFQFDNCNHIFFNNNLIINVQYGIYMKNSSNLILNNNVLETNVTVSIRNSKDIIITNNSICSVHLFVNSKNISYNDNIINHSSLSFYQSSEIAFLNNYINYGSLIFEYGSIILMDSNELYENNIRINEFNSIEIKNNSCTMEYWDISFSNLINITNNISEFTADTGYSSEIRIQKSNIIVIDRNIIKEKEIGIELLSSNNIYVLNNSIKHCSNIGILFINSLNVHCISNIFYENNIGIEIQHKSNNGYYYNNSFEKNIDYAIMVNNSYNNHFLFNIFLYNHNSDNRYNCEKIQVFDNYGNYWYDESQQIGNIWTDLPRKQETNENMSYVINEELGIVDLYPTYIDQNEDSDDLTYIVMLMVLFFGFLFLFFMTVYFIIKKKVF